MTALRLAAEEYLSIRRAVGFKLARSEGLLLGFVTFAEAEGATRVSTDPCNGTFGLGPWSTACRFWDAR